MSKLQVQLLGGVAFHCQESEQAAEITFPTKKAQALFAYMAMQPGRTFSRDTLANLLWSRSATTQAKGSLRQTLTQIRKELKLHKMEDLLSADSLISIDADCMHVDAVDFDHPDDNLSDEELQEKSDLYTDQFLAGFHLNEAQFEEWASYERNRLHNRAMQLQRALIERCCQNNRFEQGIRACQRMLAPDSLDENTHRTLMGLYYQVGRRHEALQQFATCSELLAEELAVEPAEATQQLYQDIKSGKVIDEPARVEAPAAPTVVVAGERLDDRPIVMALPFKSVVEDPELHYLADGLTEDVIIGLAQSPRFIVVDRSQAFHADANNSSSLADYSVRGKIVASKERIRVSAALMHVASNELCWSGQYDRPFSDLITIQEQITQQIVATLEPAVIEHEQQRAAKLDGQTLEHRQLLMKARWYFWRGYRKNNDLAQKLLLRAVDLRPEDVPTRVTLAFTYLTQAWVMWGDSLKHCVDTALYHARKAVRSNVNDAWAHFVLGTAYSCSDQLDLAIAEERRSLELNPYFAAAKGELGRLLVFNNQTEEGMALAMEALDVSPNDPHSSLWERSISLGHWLNGELEKAYSVALTATASRSEWFHNYLLLCVCAYSIGDKNAAQKAFATAMEIRPEYDLDALKIGHPFKQPEHLDRFIEALRVCGWKG